MSDGHEATRARWAGVALVAGGLMMAAMWSVFTVVHGPTSYNEERAVLGGSMFFWGTLLGGPPNLLVALGLGLLTPWLTEGARRSARLGYWLTLAGLVVPAAIDLSIGAMGPPLFVPVAGAGLVLLALGSRESAWLGFRREVLLGMGVLLLVGFAWALAPLEASDRVGGYRIYGVLTSFVPGLAWAVLGASLLMPRQLPLTPARSATVSLGEG
jgi:hypothetical protein